MQPLSPAQQKWVDATFEAMSLRERVGQLLVPMLTPQTAAPLAVPEFVERYHLGGGHVFGGPVEKCRRITGEAQAAARVPLLLSGDFDVGPGERIPEGTCWPGPMAIGAGGDERLAYAHGKSIAVEGRAAGYNWAFEPIVDLAAVKDYQRQAAAFGRRPGEVARLAVAAIRGMQDHGMAACAKHFPGDGFDDRDQHLMTLVNPLSPEDWWRESAVPFKAAIEAGVWSIMVSCIGLPSMDPQAGDRRNPLPALASRFLVSDLLRGRLGFEGVIVTDALNMGGVSCHYRQLDRCRLALGAGCDMLLFVRDVPRTLPYLVECVERGELEEAEINASVRRVLGMKARIGLPEEAVVPQERARVIMANRREALAAADEVAERGVTLLRDTRELVPLALKPGARIATVLITNQEKFTLEAFDATLRAAGFTVTGIKDPSTDEIHDRVTAGEFDVVVTGLYFPVLYGWNTQRIHGPFSRCLMSGFPIARPDVRPVWISFSNPNHLYELPFMDPYLVTYSGCPAAQRAAARALTGRIAITGKIPMALTDFFEVGDGVRRERRR